jgi:membrane-bound metal-dependent hydrolase YbcI (DUF457 family)
MRNAAHLAIAALTGGAAAFAFNSLPTLRTFGPAFAPVALDLTLACVLALGATLPDIDHPQTRIFKYALAVVLVATAWLTLPALGGNYLAAFGAGAIAVLAAFLLKPRHRGVTHSYKAALVYALACGLLTHSAGLALTGLVAYASHLVADA